MPGTYTKWSQQTFDFIQKYRQTFKNVANSGAIGGISAAALAGAVAKECDKVISSLPSKLMNDLLDRWALGNLSIDAVASLDCTLARSGCKTPDGA
jgi:hypothetical protein